MNIALTLPSIRAVHKSRTADTGLEIPISFQREAHVFSRLAQIEHGHILFTLVANLRLPDPNVALLQRLMSAVAVLVYVENFFIRDERRCRRIVARQIAAEDQRRAEDAPERHHRLLLIGRELGGRASAFFAGHAQFAEREHVRVRPGVVLAHELRPVAREIELLPQQLPVVPEVVGDAPHLRVLLEELRFRKGAGPGEILSTIGRPVFRIAWLRAFISAG